MSEVNLVELKEKLINERNNLLGKENKTNLVTDANETPDPVDLAAQNYTKNILISVTENETKLLQMIEEALERLEDEEYGDCLNCSKPISPKRLNAIPWAKYCINCQELLEKGLLDNED